MTPPPRKLVALHVSPWSERARWALDHHALAYEAVEHFPILGERRLRRLVGPSKPRATVPVLVAGDEVLTESWDIACYTDGAGKGTPLIPPQHEAEIRKWTALADQAMQSGRALILAAMLATPSALDEAAPPAFPALLRPLLRPFARGVSRAFVKKYGLTLGEEEAHLRAMRTALDSLREQRRASPTFLLGSFTYADIVLSTLLQGISPVADRFLRLGPATRAVWTRPALAGEYADLLAWRDEVYESSRAKP